MAISWFDGFPFKSKKQMERDKQEFLDRVFPFGMEQREYARRVLRELMPNRKYESEYLYAFISVKDKYVLEEETEEALRLARGEMANLKWFSEQEKDLVVALMLLDLRAPSLQEYPTAQDVLAFVQGAHH